MSTADTDDDDDAELTPESRARPTKPIGPVLKIEGQEWRLRPAGLAPILTETRDRIYDESILKQTVRISDCRLAAYYALHANYRLSDDEVASLVWRAEADQLVKAVIESLFPVSTRRTWTSWARSALLANGIKPADVPAEDLPLVLRHLEATQRIEPLGTFTEADEYMARRSAILNFAE